MQFITFFLKHTFFIIRKSISQKYFLFSFLMVISVLPIYGQNIEYAREIIDTLCSPEYHGRGYAYQGDKKAAAFIERQLKQHDVKSWNNSYRQKFSFPVNTFPGKVMLNIDNKHLKPGIDYIVDAITPSIKGKYKIVRLDSTVLNDSLAAIQFFKKSYKNYFVVVDMQNVTIKDKRVFTEWCKQVNPLEAAGYIELVDDRLIYHLSNQVQHAAYLYIKKDAFPENAEKIKINIQNRFCETCTTQNLIGYIPGEIDSFIVFSAHYDHLGRMGSTVYFPGAHDNASGVAMSLDLMKHFAKHENNKYSVAFMFFSAEEAGLKGSKYYNENPLFPLTKIKFLFNLDLVGSGDEGIQIVNSTVFQHEYELLQQINEEENLLKQLKPRGPAPNSDHYYFYENGVRCFFIYTLGAYKHYHNIYDTAENVPLNRYENLVRLLLQFYKEY